MGSISLLDLFDAHFDGVWKLTKEEGDYIAVNATEEELDLLVTEKMSFSQKKQALTIVKHYKRLYHDSLHP